MRVLTHICMDVEYHAGISLSIYANDYDKEKVIDELTDLICRYCIAVEYDKKM